MRYVKDANIIREAVRSAVDSRGLWDRIVHGMDALNIVEDELTKVRNLPMVMKAIERELKDQEVEDRPSVDRVLLGMIVVVAALGPCPAK